MHFKEKYGRSNQKVFDVRYVHELVEPKIFYIGLNFSCRVCGRGTEFVYDLHGIFDSPCCSDECKIIIAQKESEAEQDPETFKAISLIKAVNAGELLKVV